MKTERVGYNQGRRLFMERIKREGREKDFYARMKRVREERIAEGLPVDKMWGTMASKVMREMGFTTCREELARKEQYEHQAQLSRMQSQIKAEREAIREERKIENFEEAVRSLPVDAPDAAEIAWIRSHPAMSRKARAKSNVEPVEITAEDVLTAPHGPAPSQAAVYALQHWANHPLEFYKQLLGEQKKRAEAGERDGEVADEGLDEVERLLREVPSAVQDRDGRGEPGVDVAGGVAVVAGRERDGAAPAQVLDSSGVELTFGKERPK